MVGLNGVQGWKVLLTELAYWSIGLGGSLTAAAWLHSPMGWAIGITGASATLLFHQLQDHLTAPLGSSQKQM